MVTKHDKVQAIKLIKEKLNNKCFYSYKDIALVTGYHEKYILKLKEEILTGDISIEHGNKNKIPANALSIEEEQKIVTLYKRSKVSVRKFCKFYGKRSYSCIYNVLKRNGLI